MFQRAAGFFAGHNDNYNVSWADAARFLSSNVETHQLTHSHVEDVVPVDEEGLRGYDQEASDHLQHEVDA